MRRANSGRKPARKTKRTRRTSYDGAQVVVTAHAGGQRPRPTAAVFGRPLFGYDHPGTL